MSKLPDLAKRTCDDCGIVYDPLDGHDCPLVDHTCRHCGETFSGYQHGHDCDELPASAMTHTCPVCGDAMDSWLSHLGDCPGPT